MEIKLRYNSVDRFSESRKFKTMKGAVNYIEKWVGKNWDNGFNYFVSGDGIGKVTLSSGDVSFGDLIKAMTYGPDGEAPDPVYVPEYKVDDGWSVYRSDVPCDVCGRLLDIHEIPYWVDGQLIDVDSDYYCPVCNPVPWNVYGPAKPPEPVNEDDIPF